MTQTIDEFIDMLNNLDIRPNREYRIAPKTIRIGSYDVPEAAMLHAKALISLTAQGVNDGNNT